MASFFQKMLLLFKSKTQENENKDPVPVMRDSIYQSKINDIIVFGYSDLMELANKQFNVVGKTLLKPISGEKDIVFLNLNAADGTNLLVDYSSHRQHIYVYQEVSFDLFKTLVKQDSDTLERYLNAEEDINGITFDATLTTTQTDKLWIQNDNKYYGTLDIEVARHNLDTELDNHYSKKGVDNLLYLLSSSDQEYSVIIITNEHRRTSFYTGRRIEPNDISSVLGTE